MEEIVKHIGRVKMYNGIYGFINSDLGDIFFHGKVVENSTEIEKGDEVEFTVEPSTKIKDKFQAVIIKLLSQNVNNSESKIKQLYENYGEVSWYDLKGYGLIVNDNGECFFHKSSVKSNTSPESIKKGDKCIFNKQPSKKRINKLDATSIIFLKDCKITDEIEKSIYRFINSIEVVDTTQKYIYLKSLMDVFKSYKKTCLLNQIEISNDFKLKLWLEKYLQDIDLNLISEGLINTVPNHNYDEVFNRLNNENDKTIVLKKFISFIGNIDNVQKYSKITAILELIEIPENIKTEFTASVYDKCDDERKFSLWLDNFYQTVDFDYVSHKLVYEDASHISSVFTRLHTDKEKLEVLTKFLNYIDKIDNSNKYFKIIKILKLGNLSDEIKTHFFTSIHERCDDERKFLFWLDKYTDKSDFDFVANKLLKFRYENLDKVFSRLNENSMSIVLNKFLNIINNLDDLEKNTQIVAILNLVEIPDKIKSEFVATAIEKCGSIIRIILWLENYIKKIDADFIGEELFNISHDFYNLIFKRLNKNIDKSIVLSKFINTIGYVDDSYKYTKINSILDDVEIPEKIKNEFIATVYQKCDSYYKLCLWVENYIQNIESIIISEGLIKVSPNSPYYYKIFNKLNNDKEISEVLTKFLKITGNIEDSKKYCNIKAILSLEVIPFEIRYAFYNVAFKKSDHERKCCLFSDFSMPFQIPNAELVLKGLIKIIQIEYSFNFFNSIIEPLTDINNHYYYKGYSLLGIFLENANYIQETNDKYISSSIFRFRNLNLSPEHFEKKLLQIKLILKSIEHNKLSLLEQFRFILSQSVEEKTQFLLKDISNYAHHQKQLCKDLKIKEPIDIIDFERILIAQTNTEVLLKYWIKDLIEYFDFKSYCYYYFTLNLNERKIFNKKAKAWMKEDINKSMLKQREPWELVEEDAENSFQIYSASWKSIWFMDRGIKILIDKEPSFTQFFPWEFSEENFNLLYEYISGKRLNQLKVTAKGDKVISIEGLEQFEEVIWKIQIQREVESGEGTGIKTIGANRIPVNMILRNQCIQLLNRLQVNELEPTRILEKAHNKDTGSISVDISLLYSIPLNQNEIAVVWESLELEKSKATHIFKCLKSEYQEIFSKIDYNLASQLKMRSRLRSTDNKEVEMQKQLRYLINIDHDNFRYERWEASFFEVLPELKQRLK